MTSEEREAEMITERALQKRMLLERRRNRNCLLLSGNDDSAGRMREGQGLGLVGNDSGSGVKVGSNAVGTRSGKEASASIMENDGLAASNRVDILDNVENSTVTAPSSLSPSKDEGDNEPHPPVDRILTRMIQD